METMEHQGGDTEWQAPEFLAGKTLSELPQRPKEEDLAVLHSKVAGEYVKAPSREEMDRAQLADQQFIDEHGIDAFVAREGSDHVSVDLYRALELPPMTYKYAPRSEEEARALEQARKMAITKRLPRH